MNSITEFIFENEHTKGVHGIFEMSQISDKKDNLPLNSSIWVYGENDINGTKPPHFHIKIDNRFEFEIKFENFHNLDIWRSKTVKYDWKELKQIKKSVKEWLLKSNTEEPDRLNIEVILTEWNRQNPNHKINKQYYLDLYNKLK